MGDGGKLARGEAECGGRGFGGQAGRPRGVQLSLLWTACCMACDALMLCRKKDWACSSLQQTNDSRHCKPMTFAAITSIVVIPL